MDRRHRPPKKPPLPPPPLGAGRPFLDRYGLEPGQFHDAETWRQKYWNHFAD